MIDYDKGLVEVEEVLKYISKEDYNKISKEFLDIIKQNKDSNYKWRYDTNKKLNDQDLNCNPIIY